MSDPADLASRFTYHPPRDGQPAIYAKIRDHGLSLAALVGRHCPEGREKALALTKIEEAVMWANAAVARHG